MTKTQDLGWERLCQCGHRRSREFQCHSHHGPVSERHANVSLSNWVHNTVRVSVASLAFTYTTRHSLSLNLVLPLHHVCKHSFRLTNSNRLTCFIDCFLSSRLLPLPGFGNVELTLVPICECNCSSQMVMLYT